MPPLLLGLPGDNTFSNYAEANRAFWRQTVLPLVARVQKSFQAWLQPGFGPFRLDYNADRLEALASERAAEWERVGKAAFLTLDEQREAVGYGPARAPCNCGGTTKRLGDYDLLALDERCAEEWAWARSQCESLLNLANPPLGLTGGYNDVESCARGFVSAACGGNAV